jgi:hypothetical protein
MVPVNAAPRLINVPHSVSVHANVPKGGAEGVLFSMGGNDGGFSFYVQGGKLTYGYNYVADQRFKVQSDNIIPIGDHIFSFDFTPTGKPDIAKGKGVPAKIKLYVDGKPVGSGDLPCDHPVTAGSGRGRLHWHRCRLTGHDRLQGAVHVRRHGEESPGGRVG